VEGKAYEWEERPHVLIKVSFPTLREYKEENMRM
jgi:hypothetical protein